MTGLGIFLSFMGVAIAVIFLASRRRKDPLFTGRPSVAPENFASTYLPEWRADAPLVADLVRHLAAELGVPADKVQPDDRFEVELREKGVFSSRSGLAILNIEMHDLAEKTHQHAASDPIVTVRDYLGRMIQLLATERARQSAEPRPS